VFVCTLSFSPRHGIKPALCEVRWLASQGDRHLLSTLKPTALTMCGKGEAAVSTQAQVSARGATMPSQGRLSLANLLPNCIAWQPTPQVISASALGVPVTGRRVPVGASGGRARSRSAKAGGNPNRIGGSASKKGGRFNARGQGGQAPQG
jgi:hypothetical protein